MITTRAQRGGGSAVDSPVKEGLEGAVEAMAIHPKLDAFAPVTITAC